MNVAIYNRYFYFSLYNNKKGLLWMFVFIKYKLASICTFKCILNLLTSCTNMANDFSKTVTTGETPFRESETHNKCRNASTKGCEECIKDEGFCTISNNISNDNSFERNSWLLKKAELFIRIQILEIYLTIA